MQVWLRLFVKSVQFWWINVPNLCIVKIIIKNWKLPLQTWCETYRKGRSEQSISVVRREFKDVIHQYTQELNISTTTFMKICDDPTSGSDPTQQRLFHKKWMLIDFLNRHFAVTKIYKSVFEKQMHLNLSLIWFELWSGRIIGQFFLGQDVLSVNGE